MSSLHSYMRIGSIRRFATSWRGTPKNTLPKQPQQQQAAGQTKQTSATSTPSSTSSASSSSSSSSSPQQQPAQSMLARMHASLPRPNPAPGEKFTTLSGGGWRQAETWTPERRRAIMMMGWSWPAMVLTGLILYKRYFGTEEQKSQWLEYERMMMESAGLKPKTTTDKKEEKNTTATSSKNEHTTLAKTEEAPAQAPAP